jgi:hypothetical protein
VFLLKTANCSRKARGIGNVFPIDFSIKNDIVNPVDNCVLSAGACSRFSLLETLPVWLTKNISLRIRTLQIANFLSLFL